MKKELKNDNSASKVKAFFVKLGKGIVNIVKTVGRWLYRALLFLKFELFIVAIVL